MHGQRLPFNSIKKKPANVGEAYGCMYPCLSASFNSSIALFFCMKSGYMWLLRGVLPNHLLDCTVIETVRWQAVGFGFAEHLLDGNRMGYTSVNWVQGSPQRLRRPGDSE